MTGVGIVATVLLVKTAEETRACYEPPLRSRSRAVYAYMLPLRLYTICLLPLMARNTT